MTQQTNMTAVEWLVEKLMKGEFINNPNELIEQAKQMEKEQILNAYTDGDYQAFELEAEQYYNETYGNKSDDHVERHLEMVSFKTEISDEEIEKSNPFRIDGGAYNSSAAYQWLKGAKWYREQLKKK